MTQINDGDLGKDDLCKVLKSMMIDNEMDFYADFPFLFHLLLLKMQNIFQGFSPSLKKARRLAHILFPAGCKERRDRLTLDDFKKQLSR